MFFSEVLTLNTCEKAQMALIVVQQKDECQFLFAKRCRNKKFSVGAISLVEKHICDGYNFKI
jgi:hypothetical protein